MTAWRENCKLRWGEVWNERIEKRNYSYVKKSEKESGNWKNWKYGNYGMEEWKKKMGNHQ